MTRLAITAILLFWGTNAWAEAAPPHADVLRLQGKLSELENRLAHGKLVTQKLEELSRIRDAQLSLSETLAKLLAQKEQLLSRCEELKDTLREAARENARGERLDTLVLVDGNSYDDVSIVEVNDLGIAIRHKNGAARVFAEDLPESYHERFLFRNETAEKLLAVERERDRMRDTAIRNSLTEREDRDSSGGSSPDTSPGDAGTGHRDDQEVKRELGMITAKIVTYKKGTKQVKFKVLANCAATFTVYGAVGYPNNVYSSAISPNEAFQPALWVRNDYHSVLVSQKGKELDRESSRSKTGLTK